MCNMTIKKEYIKTFYNINSYISSNSEVILLENLSKPCLHSQCLAFLQDV